MSFNKKGKISLYSGVILGFVFNSIIIKYHPSIIEIFNLIELYLALIMFIVALGYKVIFKKESEVLFIIFLQAFGYIGIAWIAYDFFIKKGFFYAS